MNQKSRRLEKNLPSRCSAFLKSSKSSKQNFRVFGQNCKILLPNFRCKQLNSNYILTISVLTCAKFARQQAFKPILVWKRSVTSYLASRRSSKKYFLLFQLGKFLLQILFFQTLFQVLANLCKCVLLTCNYTFGHIHLSIKIFFKPARNRSSSKHSDFLNKNKCNEEKMFWKKQQMDLLKMLMNCWISGFVMNSEKSKRNWWFSERFTKTTCNPKKEWNYRYRTNRITGLRKKLTLKSRRFRALMEQRLFFMSSCVTNT